MFDFLNEEMKSLAPAENTAISPAAVETIRETGKTVAEMMPAVRAMGEMLRIMGERMTAMEKTIRTLEKVSPGQAAEINRGIRERAAEIWAAYEGQPDPEKHKAVAAAIRREVREMTGVRTAREIARCDCQAVMAFIDEWDDYDVIRKIRKGAGK